MRNVSDKIYRENKKITLYSIAFFENHDFYEIMWKILCNRSCHIWQYTRAHAHCMLDN